MFTSLRTKLTLSMLLTSSLALLVAMVVSYYLLESQTSELAAQIEWQPLEAQLEAINSTIDAEDGAALAQQQYAALSANEKLSNSIETQQAYLLLNHQGYVIFPTNEYATGEKVPTAMLADAIPLRSQGHVVGFVISSDSSEHRYLLQNQYLRVERSSMLIGALCGFILTLLFSLTVGRQLVKQLRSLTAAVQEMGRGNIKQEVPVQSNDEVALLAKTFNRMSEELQRTYDELRASNETIKAQAEAMQELSLRDELTGLHNRRYFNQQFRQLHLQASRYGDDLTLALGDIDNFKQINDRYSHQVGDAVLKQVARIMREQVREADVVARFGGEEFILLLAHTNKLQAQEVVERIRQKIETWNWQQLHPELSVTISFGICDQLGTDVGHSMLMEADAKLYQAKGAGRNRVCA
ncbi:diguanylate cyclase [Aliiglaciecola sp. CAU 1673]|uniref:diguanylate cyclase n=1 Tax=Aliiglaciecola sp. CAU 1673 TaxID=3032595 RepID=UPI0023DA9601|nr:diguanylate cyclase [Aliiglaciecola sp. CAU 1673]MDF2179200.1 diguanylate cyclase [Aliiglaciecola sp. CAU 1673]